jgi:hypothetical protein
MIKFGAIAMNKERKEMSAKKTAGVSSSQTSDLSIT